MAQAWLSARKGQVTAEFLEAIGRAVAVIQDALPKIHDSDGAQRGRHQDGQHRHSQNHLTSRQTGGQRHGTNGRLDGGFGDIGHHAEKPFLKAEGGPQQ